MVPLNEKLPRCLTRSSPLDHRVMLVDEDTRDLKHLTSLLEGMGVSVHAFGDYREAERYLERGNFDLVIDSVYGGPVPYFLYNSFLNSANTAPAGRAPTIRRNRPTRHASAQPGRARPAAGTENGTLT